MKLKNKIISLVVCLSFCLVALFNAVYLRDDNIKTHETIMNKNEIDYMSLLDEFDEKELSVMLFKFEGIITVCRLILSEKANAPN